MIKISVDVDGTLLMPSIQRYIKELVERGVDVWVTTRRFENLDDYTRDFQRQYGIINLARDHQKLFDICKDIGIPREKIRFTNMDNKYKYLGDNEGFLWHLDDDYDECKEINRYTKTVAVSCSNGSNWRHKCERLIKKKLNESK